MPAGSDLLDRFEQQRSEREQREWRTGLIASLAGHAALLGLLLLAPDPTATPRLEVVTVDLVAAPPAPGRASSAAADRPRAPAAAPEPPPEPPPERRAAVAPVAPKKVLPEDAPAATRKRRVAPAPAPRPEPLDYEDALARLRGELGEPAPDAEAAVDVPPEPGAGERGGGTRVDPELARWQRAVNSALARTWVAPPEYRSSALRTLLRVTVMADGTVIGVEVERSSGDPYFDDNAVRAVLQAGQLPPPPAAGDWEILFDPSG